ncbi:MAG: TetR/AcrR family transcriptional regulator [Thermoanaerobaculia bacterium]|nr:TetR/AcrR family transcriptional regulator [Thermoanaerobaculia bacterium]
MAKGSDTRNTILEQAMATSSRLGLDGLSIGGLARDVGLSKSGLFAHFGSKEELQLEVLAAGVEKFIEAVVKPALGTARGEPRVRALFAGWLGWPEREDLPGGCPFMSAAYELDDRPGPVRDQFVIYQSQWLSTVARSAAGAVEEKHFGKGLDVEQFAWEFQAILMAYHYYLRLLRDDQARERAEHAFERLIRDSKAQATVSS